MLSIKNLLGCFIIIMLCNNVIAQQIRIFGYVVDKSKTDTLSNVAILDDTILIGNTDENGFFNIWIDSLNVQSLHFQLIGYQSQKVSLKDKNLQEPIKVVLQLNPQYLTPTTIKAKKTKYKNKDNPAVDLIRKVIQEKLNNQQINQGYLQYDEYDKITLSINHIPKIISKNPLFKKQAFVFENVDTITSPGNALIPAYIEERYSKHFLRTQPTIDKVFLVAHKSVEVSEKFLNKDMINDYLTHIYRKIDLYDNDIMIMTNMFLSPIATSGPMFYKYFITDTTITENDTIIKLAFGPRNKTDFLFNGYLNISLRNYAIIDAELSVSKNINLNFVKNFKINTYYEQDQFQKYYVKQSKLKMEFGFKDVKQSVFGIRNLIYSNNIPHLKQPDSVYNNPYTIDTVTYNLRSDTLLHHIRMDSLTSYEANAYVNMDSLKNQKNFNNILKFGRLVMAGYYRTKYLEIGPTNAFYAFNPIEGFRLRFGGRTAIDFSRNFMIESYVAYGFKDERWKYYGSASYSFKPRSELMYNYPYNFIRISYQNDTRLPGQQPGFVQESNFFLSFKRGENDRYIYNKIFKVEYVREFSNHIRIAPSFTNFRQEPAGSWYYINSGSGDTLHSLITTTLGLQVRWAPGEKIIQSRTSRTIISNKFPIITATMEWGFKDLWDGMYDYQKYNLEITKRVFLSQLGFVNVLIGGTYYQGSELPFPLLDISTGNQTYWLQKKAYNLMNYMEFVSDKNVHAQIEYHMGGFILNKIPLIKYLRFREVFGFKMLYGGLGQANDPNSNSNVYKLPVNENGANTTYTFQNKVPYMEASVGLTNILRVMRVDLLWRLTYLKHPNVAPMGVRVSAHFDF